MRTLVLCLAVLLAVVAVAAGPKKADLKLLQRLKRVDGPGSGLDADTVRGLTPDQMENTGASALAQRVAALEAKVNGLPALPSGGTLSRDAFYARSSRDVLTAPGEKFAQVACNTPQDLAVSCSGGIIDGSGGPPIIWMGIMLGDGTNSADRCVVVVKPEITAPAVEATVRCLKLS